MRTKPYWFLILLSLLWVAPLRADNPNSPVPAPKAERFEKVEKTEPNSPPAPVSTDGWAVQPGTTGEAPLPAVWERSRILAFQVNGLFYLQAGGGNSFTGGFSWTPQFKIDRYEMRFEFGAALPKNSQADLFLAFNYEVLFRTRLNEQTRIDIGGGGMTFTGTRGVTRPVVTAQLSRFYDIKSPVNQIFIAYSLFFAPSHIHVFKAGVGFTL